MGWTSNAKSIPFFLQGCPRQRKGWTKQREVNPDQVDRELAHKAGLFKSSVAREQFFLSLNSFIYFLSLKK